jgi:flagellar hook-basal body complex protein FliE
MPVPPLSATGAYSAVSRLGLRGDAASATGAQSTQTTGGGSFAGMVRDVANQAVGSMRNAEQASVRAVSGQGGDLNSVVMAVSNAEVTLQTAVAVRDKVIAAYMDIVRMPI